MFLLVTFSVSGEQGSKRRPVKGTGCQGLVHFHVFINSAYHSSQERNKKAGFSLKASLVPCEISKCNRVSKALVCLLASFPVVRALVVRE